MARPFPTDNIEDAITAYVAGMGCQEASRQFTIVEPFLKRELVRRGLWRTPAETKQIALQKNWANRVDRVDIPIDELVSRYLAGESEKALAAAFGCGRPAIRTRLISQGVTPRGRSESMSLRMAQATPEERAQLASAAHEAVRGRKVSFEELCRSAQGRERSRSFMSPYEELMDGWLTDRGLTPKVQRAIGPYNADLTIDAVAVEIFGGGWHGHGRHRRRTAKRYRYLFDQGWAVVIIWVDRRSHPLGVAAADYVAAFVERARRDPSVRGQYWVIRGDGKELAAGQTDVDQIAIKPTLK